MKMGIWLMLGLLLAFVLFFAYWLHHTHPLDGTDRLIADPRGSAPAYGTSGIAHESRDLDTTCHVDDIRPDVHLLGPHPAPAMDEMEAHMNGL